MPHRYKLLDQIEKRTLSGRVPAVDRGAMDRCLL